MTMLRSLVLLALLALGGQIARAQPPTPSPVSVLGGYVALSVSGSSSRVALPSTTPSLNAITISNDGTVDAFYALGDNTVVATTSSTKIPAGRSITVYASGAYVAAVTATSTTTLNIYQANGPVYLTGGGSGGGGGGGGAVTVADGADVALGTTTDAAYGGSGAGTEIALLKWIGSLVNGPIAAGTNLIGQVSINQSSPGTTNNVSLSYGSNAVVNNACQTQVQTAIPINITTATTTQIVTPASASGKKVYFCSLSLQAAGGANNVGVVEGTGATCGTSTAGIYGGTTASTGLNLTANQGIAWGNGQGPVMQTATSGDGVCLITSAGVQLSGHIRVAIQ